MRPNFVFQLSESALKDENTQKRHITESLLFTAFVKALITLKGCLEDLSFLYISIKSSINYIEATKTNKNKKKYEILMNRFKYY